MFLSFGIFSMQFEFFLFFCQWIIFCNQYSFVVSKPIVGQNVKRASEGEYSFVVSIMHKIRQGQRTYTYHICTGAVITVNHILTAAHCIKDLLLNETRVVAGSVNTEIRRTYHVLWWITYNEWTELRQIQLEFKVNDIAVLRAREDISNRIRPAHLSNEPNENCYGATVTMTGWAVENDMNTTTVMQIVKVTVLSPTECENKVAILHGSKVPVHKRLLCTATVPLALMDYGDSGGPLLSNGNTIIGVNQATVPIAISYPHPDKVNVHCGIEYYKNFIADAIRPNFVLNYS